MAPDPELIEVRFFVNRDVYNVFDASCKANRTPKSKLGAASFEEWASRKIHESTVILRLIRGNGNDPHTDWGDVPE